MRIHSDAAAAEAAALLGARAYTIGSHIVMGAGEGAPRSRPGSWLLAHELAHVAQQRQQPGRPLLQRSVIDDVESAVSEVATDVASAAETVATDVASAAKTVTNAVSSAVSTAGHAVSSAVDAVEGAVSDAVTAAEDVAAAAEFELELAGARALAAATGGSVFVIGTRITIEIPEVPLFPPETLPVIELPRIAHMLPLLAAGGEFGPVLLLAELGVELAISASLAVILGPGSVRGIRIVLDPGIGTYSATGQLHLAASESLTAPGEVGIDAAIEGVIIIGDVPIPVEADIFGGLRLTLRGSGLGTFDETVTLAYHRGSIRLDLLTELKLGALIEAALDAVAELDLYDQTICEYTWPLNRWTLASVAEQFTFPLTIKYTSGKPTLDAGPLTSKPIPIGDIDAVLPGWPVVKHCKSFDEIIELLCKRGILPPDLCPPAGGAGGGGGLPPGGGGGPGILPPAGGGGGLPPTGGGGIPLTGPGEFPITYRRGSAGRKNLTPRVSDATGLSTFEKMEVAIPKGDKGQKIDTTLLTTLTAEQDPPPDFHVSIYPGPKGTPDKTKLKEWADTREKESDPEHPFTIEVREAIIDEVRRPK